MKLAQRIQADAVMLDHLGVRVNPAAIAHGGLGDEALLELDVTGVLVNALGFCHGGVVFALADTACAYALGTADFGPATTDASISYLQPGHAGDTLRADCELLRQGKRFGTVNVYIRNQNDVLIAVYRGSCANVRVKP